MWIDQRPSYGLLVLNGWPFCEKKAQSDMCFDVHINVIVLFIKIGFSVNVDCPLSSSGINVRLYFNGIVVNVEAIQVTL